MGYPKAGVNIFITCIVLVEGMADKCTTGPNIVLPCSNMTTPTNQMFIPVNGSIHTDEDNGCICNITVVELPDNIITTEVSVRIIDNNISCGYQVKAGRRIIECQNRSSSSNNIKLNESFSLLFTRDNTPSPPSTAGFCLQVITPNVNVKVTKVCREIVVRVPSPLATKPASTAKPMATTRQTMAEISNTTPLQHTMTTGASSSGAPKATISMPDTVMASLFTTEAPNTTKPVSDSLMTIPSTTETPQSRTFTVKAMSITTGNGSTASAAGVKNLATVDQLPVAAIGGGIAGGLILIISIIVIICVCKQRKTNDYDKPSSNKDDNPYHTNIYENGGLNEGEQSSTATHSTTSPWNLNPDRPNSLPTDMIIMENDMYISADSLLPDRHEQNSNIGTTNTTQPEVEDKPFSLDSNPNVSNMYAKVNNAPKSSNPKRPLIPMVPPGRSSKSNESKSPNSDKPPIPMAPPGSSSNPNEFNANGNDTVQYADIQFDKTTEL